MTQYDDTNTAVAWPNGSENIKAPQWTGKANIEGKELRVSVWIRTTKKGPTLSMKFEEPRAQSQGQQREAFNDEVPF